MAQDLRKERERVHVGCFLRLFSATEPLEVEDSERPDFLLHWASGKTVGVEVTELFCSRESGGESLQAQESLRHRVVEEACSLYHGLSSTPVQVGVFFNDSYMLRKSEVDKLATALLGIVQRNQPPEGGGHREEDYTWVNRNYFPEAFCSITVDRIHGGGNFWRAPGATYIPRLRLEDVQSVVDAKATRLSAYRESCNEIWLLLVADGFELATIVEFEADVYRSLTRRGFDRMFLLHNQKRLSEFSQPDRKEEAQIAESQSYGF